MRIRSPISGMPLRRQIWSWISFDVANQSFTLIINTLLFSPYFMTVVLPSQEGANTYWSLVFAGSMLLTVMCSPIAGAIADDRAWKKEALLVTGFGCAALTCMLGMVGRGDVALAIAIYVPANFLFNMGENFLASFLPALARRDEFGKLSGFSWACAYSAALVLLILTVLAMKILHLEKEERWSPFFVFAGVWFMVFAMPTLLFLREGPAVNQGRGSILLAGFQRLGQTVMRARAHRDLMVLLVASFFYGVAMSVIIAFASKLAKDYGFSSTGMVIFVAVVTVSGIAGTLVPTIFQDRLGHRRTTVSLLAVWLLVSLLFAGYTFAHGRAADPSTFPRWPLWVLGNLIGFGLGSLGAANRAFVGYLTPPDRTAEFFGLWGLIFKLAAIGTIPFAVARDRLGDPASFLLLAGFVLTGLVITLFVDDKAGSARADPAESV